MSLDTQTGFAAALRDVDRGVPKDLVAWNRYSAERRFAVYRNNVAMALTGALASRFPVTESIVGVEFFAAMATEFIRAHPPRSPLLLAYGDELATFVETFEPAAELAYLPGVLLLEAARGKAYHAADAMPLDAAKLAAVDPDSVAAVVFKPHPSLTVLRFAHPVVTIWAMNAGEIELGPIDDWCKEDAIVVRPQMIVNVQRLPPGGAAFLMALADGDPLGMAAEAATREVSTFDLSANLAGALQAGAFTAIR